MPKTDADLAAYAEDNHIDLPKDSKSCQPQHQSTEIPPHLNKLMGIFFEDISHADGGLSVEMLQNGDLSITRKTHRHRWNTTTAWVGVEKEGIATETG